MKGATRPPRRRLWLETQPTPLPSAPLGKWSADTAAQHRKIKQKCNHVVIHLGGLRNSHQRSRKRRALMHEPCCVSGHLCTLSGSVISVGVRGPGHARVIQWRHPSRRAFKRPPTPPSIAISNIRIFLPQVRARCTSGARSRNAGNASRATNSSATATSSPRNTSVGCTARCLSSRAMRLQQRRPRLGWLRRTVPGQQ